VPGALEQIVDNYIDNALNAGESGNEITVSAANEGGWATVHVTDRGPGMPTDQLQHATWAHLEAAATADAGLFIDVLNELGLPGFAAGHRDGKGAHGVLP
jgi:K+-sensing histidine kinase KdpD